jgi:chromosome segregation ATPase
MCDGQFGDRGLTIEKMSTHDENNRGAWAWPFIGAGLLLLIAWGLYALYFFYFAAATLSLSQQIDLSERRFEANINDLKRQQSDWQREAQQANTLMPKLTGIGDLRAQTNEARQLADSLNSKIKQLEQEKKELDSVIEAMSKARIAALEEKNPISMQGLLHEFSNLENSTDWKQARPLIEELNADAELVKNIQENANAMGRRAEGESNPTTKESYQSNRKVLLEQLADANKKLDDFKRQYQDLEDQLSRKRDAKQEEIAKSHAELQKVQSRIDNLEKQIQSIQDELKQLTNAEVPIDDVQATTGVLANKINDLALELKDSETSILAKAKELVDYSRSSKTSN